MKASNQPSGPARYRQHQVTIAPPRPGAGLRQQADAAVSADLLPGPERVGAQPCNRRSARAGAPGDARGAALIVGLIILLIMVVLGISGMRTSMLEELMAGHSKDTNSAFQAAEAGTQAALNYLISLRVPPRLQASGATVAWPGTPVLVWPACEVGDPDPSGAAGFAPCGTLDAVITGWASATGATGTTLAGQPMNSAGGAALSGIATDSQPHFVIESRYVPPLEPEKAAARKGFHYFTVSAVGFDPGTNSRAILQTTITKLF